MTEGADSSIIRAGVEAIARWRRENAGETINAGSVAIERLDLSGADLSGANLIGGRFKNCNLSHASFKDTRLNRVVFDNCILDDVDFSGADLTKTQILAVSLDGARFGRSRSLGRLDKFEIVNIPLRNILVDRGATPWYDKFISWEKLRFLAKIRIFVPAYASLTLTVLYLNGLSWYNSLVEFINKQLAHLVRQPLAAPFALAEPTWAHIAVIINFICLAAAATLFLACPARISEFSRERWLNEIKRPEILYDFATWRMPVIRFLCAATLLSGGLISAILLARAIFQQIAYILNHTV